MTYKGFGNMDLEPILYARKLEKNREKYGDKEESLIPLSEVGIYEVSFPFHNRYLIAGYMLSGHKPEEEDFLDLTPMKNLKQQGKELVKEGEIETIEDFWKAFCSCREKPNLIKYRKLSKKEWYELVSSLNRND